LDVTGGFDLYRTFQSFQHRSILYKWFFMLQSKMLKLRWVCPEHKVLLVCQLFISPV
jgi:hypothetical protein